jgi:hypothetical protein
MAVTEFIKSCKNYRFFEPLKARLLAEMEAGDTTDLRPWMTRAGEIMRELMEREHEAGSPEEQ